MGYQNRFRSDAQYLKKLCEAGEHTCIVSEILEAVYESAKTGKAIYFEGEDQ